MTDLIKDGAQWIAMLDDRNLAAHTYDEKKVVEIYRRIKLDHFPQLTDLALQIDKAVSA